MKRLAGTSGAGAAGALGRLFRLVAAVAVLAGPVAEAQTYGTGAGSSSAQLGLRQAPAGLSVEMQRALERGDTRRALALFRRLKAPGGGAQKYECTKYSCACAGVVECVKLIATPGQNCCKEGTVKCNDDGCVCEKNTQSDC